jgi:benzoyl-CoA reductase/2-hydroxyglutaryl-CoA dehydratase subunit BcrC/BadD/HgdB
MNHVRRLIQDYRIDGIVYEALKFCDLYGEDYPIFKENIKDMEVPSLLLTRDYFTAGMGQMKTRIQAFFETLQE